MRLRTEPQQPQIRLRTPRVPSVPSTNDSFLKALTKEIFLFDQSFFISLYILRFLTRIVIQLKLIYLKLISQSKIVFQLILISQFYSSNLAPAS